MDPAVFLKLKCHFCGYPLSHFPIYISSDKHNVCGRCSSSLNPDTSAQNEVYEAVAKFVEFPCRNKPDGCPAQVLPQDVPKHEQDCEFQKLKCPLEELAECKWEGPRSSHVYHCQDEHGELFLKNGTFQLDLSRPHKKDSWLECNSHLFVIKQNFSPINKLLEIFICKNGDVSGFYFSCVVSFRTANMLLSVNCHEKVFRKEEPVEIFLDSLTERDGQSLVTGKITLDVEEGQREMAYKTEKVNYKFLNCLMCVTCSEYCLPPIYSQGSTNIVGKTVTRCNDCMSTRPIKDKQYTRNIFLDQMVGLLDYPCRNKGCSFIAKPPEMKRHLESCPYTRHDCLLSDKVTCTWTGVVREINGHIRDTHSKMIISELVSQELPSPLTENRQRRYLLKFQHFFFRLDFQILTTRYNWIVQMISPFEPGFIFEVAIIYDNNKRNSFVASQPCVPFSKAKVEDAGIYFNVDQMLHLHNSNETSVCKVRVFKGECSR